jgi:hypothetical protein
MKDGKTQEAGTIEDLTEEHSQQIASGQSEAPPELDELMKDPLAGILIGGNHLASALVLNIGADFHERFPPDADPEAVHHQLWREGRLGVGSIVYDAWVCWAAIMRARRLDENSPHSEK